MGKEKVYASHEVAYQNLKKKGAKSWNEMYSTKPGEDPDHVGIDRKRLIDALLEKEWSPKSGKALEIGCGTGPLIRWISEKGFQGTGIDISSTAIEIAVEQSEGLNIDFLQGDFCYSDQLEKESFDLVVDGHCFHCIVEDEDRKRFIQTAYNLLKKDGVFLLCTMCSPIDRKSLPHKAKYQDNILYTPYETELEGSKKIGGKLYMAQRKLDHWKDILKLVKDIGFDVKMFQYQQGEPFSSIYLAATIK